MHARKVQKTCIICGKNFETNQYHQKACFGDCSRKWQSMSRKKKAKLLGNEYDDSINIISLINRDGLICSLCGLPCLEQVEVNENTRQLMATIDHVVPFSLGGPHTWSNVRVAHLCCNITKNDGHGVLRTEYLREHVKELYEMNGIELVEENGELHLIVDHDFNPLSRSYVQLRRAVYEIDVKDQRSCLDGVLKLRRWLCNGLA